MAYKIPLSNYPNQTFYTTIPVNEGNIDFTVTLNYNSVAEYWTMTLVNTTTQEVLFSGLPLLTSYMRFANILAQLGYKLIGSAYVFPLQWTEAARPDDTNLGKDYVLLWSDNGI